MEFPAVYSSRFVDPDRHGRFAAIGSGVVGDGGEFDRLSVGVDALPAERYVGCQAYNCQGISKPQVKMALLLDAKCQYERTAPNSTYLTEGQPNSILDLLAILAIYHSMNTFTATDAKNRFGELLEAVHREPIEIDKKGRPVAVMLSYNTYQEMKKALGDAKKPSDLSWLGKWRETATLAPAASEDDEDTYHDHLDRKYGR